MADQKSCIVLGASSQPGSWLVPSLLQDGWTVHLISRGVKPQLEYGANARWHSLDLRDPTLRFPEVKARVVFDTLGASPAWLGAMRSVGAERAILFSSSSVLTKVDSTDLVDAQGIANIVMSERTFAESCDQQHIAWTIFRPTLIYGGKFGDRTVQDIARVIRLLGFFPVFGKASGLRQPVHADDLAIACRQVCDNSATFGKTYQLAGDEILSYRDMVRRIFQAMGKTPRFLRIPLPVFELAAKVLRLHPRYAHIRSSMAERMQKDMTFSNDAATLDFGYEPRRFKPVVGAGAPVLAGHPEAERAAK
ncbi:NAD-dependent epimerase/dehydratase family protein [Bradyrhizobium sp. SEMIA]|uniref:NAD-dependent epimerase/dehydratase family protein n=1 Tax=Bradyrhizobium sp. SEMIA TaxID=2597515 RepID=UPI0018A5570A|nr:NAD-dependent epimerase/dehydratase family protein [Bradyrhizobium sp. SEMIA]QOG17179.1 hypothetical protein FOM02_07295 [Bradyrhizobium sp. SEMIA]